MKKFKLLVAPLLVLPFIVACNSGGGSKGPLTKEEFDYANSLIDVEKVQINSLTDFEFTYTSEEGEKNVSMINDKKMELAPSINHNTNLYTNKEGGIESKFGNEGYSRLIPDDDKHCEYVIKDIVDEDWGEPEEGDIEECYCYPTQCALKLALEDAGFTELKPALTYENTEFKNGKFVYKGASTIVTYNSDEKTLEEPSSLPVTINIAYKNKKLINVDVESDEVATEETKIKVTASIAYAYEDITPTWPLSY